MTLVLAVTDRPVRWYLGGPKGEWDPVRRRVGVRHGMSDEQTRSTLAHELAHALHGDAAGHDSRAEHRADLFAARLLISPGAFAGAEALYGTDTDRIAEELCVTCHLVDVWRAAVRDAGHA